MKTKEPKRINFMKPPFKGVFKSVRKVLSDKYERDITIEAISQAYDRCDPIVVRLVKGEIEKRIPGYDARIHEKQKAKDEKKHFENLIVSKYETLEA